MKHLVTLLVLSCLVTSFCSAQSPKILDPKDPIPAKISIAVTFITNDTCYLRIDNGKNNIKIVKNRTISLPVGNYRLDFESWETGEIIKNRSFQLTKDSVTDGRYTYPVTFK